MTEADDVMALQQRVRALEIEVEREKQAARLLRASLRANTEQSDERFRLLVEGVKDYAIFRLDTGGHVTTWNTGAERLKGYAREEILGEHFSKFYPPEDVAAGKCETELEVATRVGRVEDEGWRVRKDGTRFWANVVITALHGADGTLLGFAKVTRDLTERVRAEKEGAHRMAIEEANRRKDEFLAIMGHELRNPLASLVTVAHLIKLRGGRASEKEIAILERQSRHMTRLVDDLLDASSALREKVSLLPKPVEVGDLLANAVELTAPLVEERRQHLTVDVPKRGLVVNVDPERMAQVLGNLLANAAKYTSVGGRIRLGAVPSGDDLLVTIEDNGQGIAPEMLAQIFELFVQGEQGVDRKTGGLGIGLAVAKKLVEAHHGEIMAASEGIGRGSRFSVRLPLVRERTTMDDVPSSALRAAKSNVRRVLLVDDNQDSLEMMQHLLEHLGHTTCTALDGPSAVVACRDFAPDIVFLDIGLPGLSGYDVAAQLRALPGCAHIPIIAVSGYARDADRARAMDAGFTAHVAKPLEMSKLEELVRGA